MKKIVKLSTKEILNIISSTGYNKRRLFDFTFSDEDVAPLMTDTYKGCVHRNLGEFIARCSIANDEYLNTPSIFDSPRVLDSYTYTLFPSTFVETHAITKDMTVKILDLFKSCSNSVISYNTRASLARIACFVPDDVINTYSYHDSSRHEMNRYFESIFFHMSRLTQKQGRCLIDAVIDKLDNDSFIQFIAAFTNITAISLTREVVQCTTEKMWNRMMSLMHHKRPASVIIGRDLPSCCKIIKKYITDIVGYKLTYFKDSIFNNRKIMDDLISVAGQIYFDFPCKAMIDLSLQQGLVDVDKVDDYFSAKHNMLSFIKIKSIPDDVIARIIDAGYTLSVAELNIMSKERPMIFSKYSTDSITAVIESKINQALKGDVKKFIDDGLITVDIKVNISDPDACSLYLMLNSDK